MFLLLLIVLFIFVKQSNKNIDVVSIGSFEDCSFDLEISYLSDTEKVFEKYYSLDKKNKKNDRLSVSSLVTKKLVGFKKIKNFYFPIDDSCKQFTSIEEILILIPDEKINKNKKESHYSYTHQDRIKEERSYARKNKKNFYDSYLEDWC